MNLAEHPLALDLTKRIAAVQGQEEKTIPVQIYFPGMGQMMGACRKTSTPGLFVLASNVNVEGTGQTGVMDFHFTCDKVTTIIHPDLNQAPGGSNIVQ